MSNLEKKITYISKFYGNTDIEIKVNSCLNGKISFNDTNIDYDKETGYMRIKDSDNFFLINSVDINSLEYTNEKVHINLDNSLNVIIQKK